ncbi:unnamed protein product, partial [Urochloa humidicola]
RVSSIGKERNTRARWRTDNKRRRGKCDDVSRARPTWIRLRVEGGPRSGDGSGAGMRRRGRAGNSGAGQRHRRLTGRWGDGG